jgi:cell division protein FtsB
MRWLAAILALLLLVLQYRLWVGDGSMAEVKALRGEIRAQTVELNRLRARNQNLEAEVLDLREGLEALEERARSELGMIKEGEMFLQVIEEQAGDTPERTTPTTTGEARTQTNARAGLSSREGDGLARREVTVAPHREP